MKELVGYEGPHRIYRVEREDGTVVYEGMDWIEKDRVMWRNPRLAEVEVQIRDYREERGS